MFGNISFSAPPAQGIDSGSVADGCSGGGGGGRGGGGGILHIVAAL